MTSGDDSIEPTSVEGPSDADNAIEPPASKEAGTTRRDALLKAAAASSVAAAVWAAPRVDGLSLRPDYASAGTVRGTFSFSRNANENAAVPYAVPVAGGGNETIVATYAHTPGTGTGNINVSFASMDQPFNSNCKVIGATGGGGGETNCFAISNTGNIRPTVNSNTSVSWDHYNPWWGNTNQAALNNVTFTIQC